MHPGEGQRYFYDRCIVEWLIGQDLPKTSMRYRQRVEEMDAYNCIITISKRIYKDAVAESRSYISCLWWTLTSTNRRISIKRITAPGQRNMTHAISIFNIFMDSVHISIWLFRSTGRSVWEDTTIIVKYRSYIDQCFPNAWVATTKGRLGQFFRVAGFCKYY